MNERNYSSDVEQATMVLNPVYGNSLIYVKAMNPHKYQLFVLAPKHIPNPMQHKYVCKVA